MTEMKQPGALIKPLPGQRERDHPRHRGGSRPMPAWLGHDIGQFTRKLVTRLQPTPDGVSEIDFTAGRSENP
jgi:hypothetical protein